MILNTFIIAQNLPHCEMQMLAALFLVVLMYFNLVVFAVCFVNLFLFVLGLRITVIILIMGYSYCY